MMMMITIIQNNYEMMDGDNNDNDNDDDDAR